MSITLAGCARSQPSARIAPKLPSMSDYERILVPTDMSDDAELALRYALYFNEKLGSRITLLHAKPMPLFTAQPLGWYLENAPDARRDVAERLRDYARATVPPGVRVETIVIDDTPAHAIVETADAMDADLIILGKDDPAVARVLCSTARPVLTVTPRLFETSRGIGFQSIVCPLSSAPAARVALEHADLLAQTFGGTVSVVDSNDTARVLDVANSISADAIVAGRAARDLRRLARQPVLTVTRQPVLRATPEAELVAVR